MDLAQLKQNYPLPFTLLETQEQDILNLLKLPKALLDLPVGYGKTVIATYVALGHDCDRILVVMPPILIRQWTRWIDSIPNSGEPLGYAGTPVERKEFQPEGKRWLMCSYQILHRDFQRIKGWLARGQKSAVVVDECQNLKNSGSNLFRHIKELSNDYCTWLMTGTPMSSPNDAYAYIKIKTPEVYRDFDQFERIHVAEYDYFDKAIEWRNLDLLKQNLRMSCVHRDKKDVHKHLKARTWPIYYDLAPAHMALYTKLLEEQLLLLDDGGKIDGSTAQKLYNAAQQIIVNYDVFSGKEDARAAVFDLVDEICDEVAVHRPDSSKIIFWSWFRQTTKSVTAYLANYNAVAAYSEVDSKKSVERFMEDPTCRILVAQPGSAGAGLNPQYCCAEAAFIETPTRTIQFRQAAGRIDRQGQTKIANNRILVASGTIQETLFKRLLENDDLVTQAGGTKASLRSELFGRV